ncbi:AsnC family transcriptional regulator [Halapricum hydrolyticum]|uniref:AsnC family transcriptional regulator n=1 Tax=Halapricum hydrolyticum TaxID=2979991 RepID=A0AAE3IC73_9EURY|nr:AsnC family transcriptional regulator [Halapricum hydrolyticum]MCU4717414.1 AsnC family transcriptional regulator [Halapricum hydrolyticum]MCU4726578.1 AsnC family transcriptional regulator [Halapricum hydrolyticum]
MRELDETDLEILSLLAENARRPYSEIGEAVGLSGPAVSDRVTRLQEAGIIRNFTIDVDRSELRAGVPVLIRLETEAIDRIRNRLREADPVEHVFVTAEGEIWFYARAEARNVRTWIESLLDGTAATYSVTLIEEAEWTPSIDGLEFALTCAECGNTVDAEGETTRIDGDVYHFCCPSCLDRFESRYRQLEQGA